MALNMIQDKASLIGSSLRDALSQLLSSSEAMILLSHFLEGVIYFLTPLLAILIVIRCGRSLLQGRLEPEVWGRLTDRNGNCQIIRHWEILLGRSKRCDIVVNSPSVSRNHAVMERDDSGKWLLYPLRTKNGVFRNGKMILQPTPVSDGDVIGLGGVTLSFHPSTAAEEAAQAKVRTRPGKEFSPGVTLILLSMFQAILALRMMSVVEGGHQATVLLSFAVLAGLMWGVYIIYRIFRRTGFEVETLAFFLVSLCLTVTANAAPATLMKQLASVILGLILFIVLSIVLRDLKRAKKLRWPAAVFAVVLLAFNLLLGQRLFGAKNWVKLGPLSFQPSELVKVIFILVGATTLDRMFARRNLIFTLVFSAYCVGCLALMSDFGTALIFFVAFLAIAFMRSGDLPSVAFMTAAAGFAGFLVVSYKPYIARRFLIYRHVWEDPAGLGYQQTRTLSAIASGGLFGRGLGNGWLKNIGAANTDLVFGVLTEELGLIIAVLAVIVIILLALFAVKYAAGGRSTFYVIASCAAAMIFVVQTMLNVFGSTDLLPLTGVTLPFVSCGGSSMISCWCLLAFIKASDTRQNAGIAIRLPKKNAAGEYVPVPDSNPGTEYHPFTSATPDVESRANDLNRFSEQSNEADRDFTADLILHTDRIPKQKGEKDK